MGLHDSNVAASIDGKVLYAKSERVTGIKHHKANLDFVKQICKEWQLDNIDAIAFSDGNRNNLGICEKGKLWQQVEPIKDLFNAATFCLDHHYCHVLSAWPLVNLATVDTGIAIDGRGDHGIRRCVISNPGSDKAKLAYHDSNFSIGSLLELIGQHMQLSPARGWNVDLAGKVMGAQAYGKCNNEFISSINIKDIGANFFDLVNKIHWQGSAPINVPDFFNFANDYFRDWLSSVHRIIELETLDFFKKHASASNKIVYGGGCAQNVVCNDYLIQHFPDLTIPPHSYDGGISIGAIEFLRIINNAPAFSTDGFPYWQHDIESEIPSSETIKHTAELLAKNKIVGWFQGRGEIGPRALGNRSILMNPYVVDGKKILNSRVKHRESWRPYGASVIFDHTKDWFDIERESPYMLRSVTVPKTKRDIISSVVHADGSCRIQTVRNTNNPIFFELLHEFYELTGIPMLLNTSLNGGGDPIFSSRKQCFKFAQEVDIDAVVTGDYIHSK